MFIQHQKFVLHLFSIAAAALFLSGAKKPVPYDKCFCLFGIRKDGHANPGSAFVVKGNYGYYLVTARHVIIEKQNKNDTAVNFKFPMVRDSRSSIQVRNMHNEIIFRLNLVSADSNFMAFHFYYDSIINGAPDIGVMKFNKPSDEFTSHCFDLADLSDDITISKKTNAYGIGYPGRKIMIDSGNKKTLVTVDTLGMQVYNWKDHFSHLIFTYDHLKEGKGMSGGPIIDPATNKVIGVIAGDSIGTYAYYVKQIIAWLDRPEKNDK